MAARLKILVLLASLTAVCGAADWESLKPEGYVSDFAHVVDPSTRAALNAYCAQVEKATGAQLALVTIPTLDGEPIEDVANLLYRKWGIGEKKSNEGVLVLLVIGDRRSRVEVGYGLEPLIPDGFAGSVLRDMRPMLRNRDYGGALAEAAYVLGEKIAQSKGVAIGKAAPRRAARPRQESTAWPVLLIGGGVVLVLLMLLGGGRRPGSGSGFGGGGGGFLTGLILGQLLGGGGPRSRSGGGFGGYDSGDSFGGFGGGDSGGGGASSDW